MRWSATRSLVHCGLTGRRQVRQMLLQALQGRPPARRHTGAIGLIVGAAGLLDGAGLRLAGLLRKRQSAEV